jgi:short-subunit dehydrogenase
VTDEDSEQSFQLNFFAALRVRPAAQMLEQGGGSIVDVASACAAIW